MSQLFMLSRVPFLSINNGNDNNNNSNDTHDDDDNTNNDNDSLSTTGQQRYFLDLNTA